MYIILIIFFIKIKNTLKHNIMRILSEKERGEILASLKKHEQIIVFDYTLGPLDGVFLSFTHILRYTTVYFIEGNIISFPLSTGWYPMKKEDIIAIMDPDGDVELHGLPERYIVLRPDVLKKRKDGGYELNVSAIKKQTGF